MRTTARETVFSFMREAVYDNISDGRMSRDLYFFLNDDGTVRDSWSNELNRSTEIELCCIDRFDAQDEDADRQDLADNVVDQLNIEFLQLTPAHSQIMDEEIEKIVKTITPPDPFTTPEPNYSTASDKEIAEYVQLHDDYVRECGEYYSDVVNACTCVPSAAYDWLDMQLIDEEYYNDEIWGAAIERYMPDHVRENVKD